MPVHWSQNDNEWRYKKPTHYRISRERYLELRQAERRESTRDRYPRQVKLESHAKVLQRFASFHASVVDIQVSDRPCLCGRPHYALDVKNGRTYSICPLLYYQKMAQQIITKKGDLSKWTESQPLSKFLVRLPGAADATFIEEET